MIRLLHALGRRRGTHCERCGHSVKRHSALAIPRHRYVHFFPRDCGGSVAS